MTSPLGAERTAETSSAARLPLPVPDRLRCLSGKRAFSPLIGTCGTWFLLACAAQGPPQPPRVERPERVTDLEVVQIGRAFELSFTPPLLATDGQRLSKPLEVQIFHTITLPGEKPDTRIAFNPWVTLLVNDLAPYANGQKIVYTDRLPDQEFSGLLGATFTFTVRGLTRGFTHRTIESELSNIVPTTLLDVSGPVENLEIRPTEKALELRWSPPSRSLSGRPQSNLAGYHVYRSPTGKPGSFQLLAESASATYLDPDFEFDRTYFYKVRAVFKEDGRVAESEDSPPGKITPQDIFPPAAPTGLSALYAAGAVELIWTANTEPDVAGYNVYRREEKGQPRRINKDLVPTPIFRDSSVEPEHRYFYVVTAVDLANNESPPSEEVAVETR